MRDKKTALESAESVEQGPLDLRGIYREMKGIAVPVVEQEPVAWMEHREGWQGKVIDLNMSGRGVPLYTHPAPAVPAGWTLVPKDPTDEMRVAALLEIEGEKSTVAIYKAMIAAAPDVEKQK